MKNLIYIAGLVAVSSLLISCEGIWPNCVDGNGVIITETRTVSDFNRVESDGDFEVTIYNGATTDVKVEADENLMNLIITRVSGDQLIIETRHGNCLRSTGPIRVTVTTPELIGVDLDGSGSIWCDSLSAPNFDAGLDGSGTIQFEDIQASKFTVDLSGSGALTIHGSFDESDVTIDGSGDITLTGQSPIAKLNIIGSGIIEADNMVTDTCHSIITGSGTIYTRVNNLMEVDITGSGIVYYYGDAAVNTNILGSGQVIKKD